MTMIVVMMMILLWYNGYKQHKNQKAQQKREKPNAYCFAPYKNAKLYHDRGSEEKDWGNPYSYAYTQNTHMMSSKCIIKRSCFKFGQTEIATKVFSKRKELTCIWWAQKCIIKRPCFKFGQTEIATKNFYKEKELTCIFAKDVNKAVISDKVSCNNEKNWGHTADH